MKKWIYICLGMISVAAGLAVQVGWLPPLRLGAGMAAFQVLLPAMGIAAAVTASGKQSRKE